mmetsp:Transcript_2401/g.5195  ORF Transcript_2401/g.5195 Transcript_2401/m.5195 type:complete len:328 (-) Transcript_2401:77-1060(-)
MKANSSSATSDGWISRKRKNKEIQKDRKLFISDDTSHRPTLSYSTESSSPPISPSVSGCSLSSSIPDSLTPHLGWTKISLPCPVSERAKERRSRGRNAPVNSRKVVGKAIFFLHDPNARLSETKIDGHADNVGENTTWFQGRFFPSSGMQSRIRHDSDSVQTKQDAPITAKNSWGLLGIQNVVIDECLRCSEGGYRELDLTFIQHIISLESGEKKKNTWTAKSIVWTGGDMMRLSTDDAGVKFEPTSMFGGSRARDIGEKYFPSLLKLLLQNVSNNCGCEDIEDDTLSEAIAVIGDMEIEVPASSFAIKDTNSNVDLSSDDDGLWDD